jgi:hypothetical protein
MTDWAFTKWSSVFGSHDPWTVTSRLKKTGLGSIEPQRNRPCEKASMILERDSQASRSLPIGRSTGPSSPDG